MNLIAPAQTDALLKEIERQAKDEIRVIVDTAEREADTIVAQAHANVRRRMHDAIEQLRREGARRRSRAKAQVETEQRMRDQQHAVEAIDRAWPLLLEALAARWRDSAGRRVWTTSAARQARERLRHGTWIVQHPADWNADEQRDFRAALDAGDAAKITFTIDNEVTAGLRIRAEQATLDATPQGLLADQSAIAAMFLAEMGQGKE